jgi:hypothetical protein
MSQLTSTIDDHLASSPLTSNHRPIADGSPLTPITQRQTPHRDHLPPGSLRPPGRTVARI